MPEMVLNRSYALVSKGHVITFQKGQPVFVPQTLVKEAAGIGAEMVDGGKVDPLDPEAPAPAPELTAEEREKELLVALDLLVEKNSSEDFGGDGKPTVKAVSKLVNFEPSKKEILAAWQKRNELKAG